MIVDATRADFTALRDASHSYRGITHEPIKLLEIYDTSTHVRNKHFNGH
jgi:hypothetical protein